MFDTQTSPVSPSVRSSEGTPISPTPLTAVKGPSAPIQASEPSPAFTLPPAQSVAPTRDASSLTTAPPSLPSIPAAPLRTVSTPSLSTARVSAPSQAAKRDLGKLTSLPETFYIPPKRPTVGSRLVVVLLGAALIGAIMWGAGFLLSETIDINLPFFVQKRKPPRVPAVPSDVPVELPVTAVPLLTPPSTALPSEPVPLPQVEQSREEPLSSPPILPPLENQSERLELPVSRVPSALDSDTDGLTDEEEKLFLTSPSNPDSDGDGFRDGDEVVKFYAPDTGSGKQLEETGFVIRYTNPVSGLTILYPKSWLLKATDNTAQEVLITSPTGEFVSILEQSNSDLLPIRDWYSKQNPSTDPATFAELNSGSGLAGIESPDGLTAYFAGKTSVIVVAYNIGLRSDANFLTTVAMMRKSLTAPVK